MVNRRLLIFIKNPELGKAKTRLAQTIGDEKALEVYLMLLAHTRGVAEQVEADRWVYYSQFVDETDAWSRPAFEKAVQEGQDLGAKMLHAFAEAKEAGSQATVIIGSDCIQLQPQHVEAAFSALESHDFVIGPAEDGGYYLLGMQEPHPPLFQNMEWSTETVFSETLERIRESGKSVHLLETLSDVDHESDLNAHLRSVLD